MKAATTHAVTMVWESRKKSALKVIKKFSPVSRNGSSNSWPDVFSMSNYAVYFIPSCMQQQRRRALLAIQIVIDFSRQRCSSFKSGSRQL